jgi:hypothetical protein
MHSVHCFNKIYNNLIKQDKASIIISPTLQMNTYMIRTGNLIRPQEFTLQKKIDS